MNKSLIVISFFAVAAMFLIHGPVSAQQEMEVGVTLQDLGVENPGLLPTSPFYFLKEWRRGIAQFFTFNSVRKTELELDYASQKAAEIKKLEEVAADNIEALQKALENYKENIEALQERLGNLKETSQNPNIDELLNKLAERSLKHEELFDALMVKFEDREELRRELEGVRDKVSEILAEPAKRLDSSDIFKDRLEKLIKENYKEAIRQVKAIEILDRLDDKLEGRAKEEIEDLKDDLLEEVEDSASNIAREIKISEGTVRELIEEAKEKITEAETKLKSDLPAEIVRQANQALQEAKFHLGLGEKSLNENKIGEAFGHLTSANVHARNALRYIERDEDDEIDSFEDCAEAGYPILESFPEQCKTPDGRTFINRENNEEREERDRPEACIELYDPVCGADGKTYSNSCYAERAGVRVVSKGQCSAEKSGEVREVREFKVTITGDGFLPRELKIRKGDTVTWVNNSSRNVWPASALHPTHDVYPEKGGCIASAFDACRGLKTGESWSFKFNSVGTWKYHDHLNTSWTGSVVVTE